MTTTPDIQPLENHPGLLQWLLLGERGISSNAIAAHLTGMRPSPASTPADPSDFRRCLQLLDAVPTLRPLLPRMATLTKRWGRMVAAWDDIEAEYHRERTVGTGCPETYRLIQAANGELR